MAQVRANNTLFLPSAPPSLAWSSPSLALSPPYLASFPPSPCSPTLPLLPLIAKSELPEEIELSGETDVLE